MTALTELRRQFDQLSNIICLIVDRIDACDACEAADLLFFISFRTLKNFFVYEIINQQRTVIR